MWIIRHALRRPYRFVVLAVLAVIVLTGALMVSSIPPSRQELPVQDQVVTAATQPQPPRVTVATATRVDPNTYWVLQGDCLPLIETAIYPRTTGYVKRRTVDIGDRVKAGQLLAEISSPEVDAELEQARATLIQHRANLARTKAQEAYAKAEERRETEAYHASISSKNEFDITVALSSFATATVATSEATLQVDAANIRRLETLQSFQKITAPFDGVITAKNIDPGTLVVADAPATTRELFHLMRTDILRLRVNVPETFSTTIKIGQPITVYRREDPGRTFTGTVARTADALDLGTHTLLTEVHVPNSDNFLRPGRTLQVRFIFERKIYPIVIPSTAVVVRNQSPMVGVLDANQAIHYRTVQLGGDYGGQVEVTEGLKPGETIVVHPSDDLREGTVVQPEEQPAKRS